MNGSWFRWVLVFCGVVLALVVGLVIYIFSVIGRWEVSKPIEITKVGNFWLGAREGGDFVWKASESSELKFDLSYFWAKVVRVDAENNYFMAELGDGQKVRVQMMPTLINRILFQIPVGRNYLSLHHLNESVTGLRQGELVFIFGRMLSLDLTGGNSDDRIIFGVSEVVRRL
jgi:hypothetical protein